MFVNHGSVVLVNDRSVRLSIIDQCACQSLISVFVIHRSVCVSIIDHCACQLSISVLVNQRSECLPINQTVSRGHEQS